MIVDIVSAAQRRDWGRARQLLYQHWVNECPKVYEPNPLVPWENSNDEAHISATLIQPLASALCVDSTIQEPSLDCMMAEVESLKTSTVCGHVFKCGELTYTCKECATDPTCVMCNKCFQQSIHKEHKYKMHASGGAGYCDCGDADAWTRGNTCAQHSPEANSQTTPTPAIPEDVSERIRELITIVLQYSTGLVCWEIEDQLPPILTRLDDSDKIKDQAVVTSQTQFLTVLYNDETHTYDSVIRALEMAIDSSREQAMLIATIVDREGRASVRLASKAFCETVKESIQKRTGKDTSRRTEKSGPLTVKVMDCTVVAHQSHAIGLLQWLNSQLEKYSTLGDIIGDVLLNVSAEPADLVLSEPLTMMDTEMDEPSSPFNVVQQTLAERVMLWNKKMWKAARSHYHELLMKTVLMNAEHKIRFAKLFIENYDVLYNDYVDDDHELEISIVSLSVQFLTVPTIARRLIAENSALTKIINTLMAHTNDYLKAPTEDRERPDSRTLRVFDFTGRVFPAVVKRAMQTMRDIVYMLNSIPTVDQWSDELRTQFLEGADTLISFLHYMQGMDPVKRQAMEHQVWEMEWETAFNIQLRTQEAIGLFLQWANSDRYVHVRMLEKCFRAMLEHPVNYGDVNGATHIQVELNETKVLCGSFDVLSGWMSIHQPLWRLTAGLFSAPPHFLAFLEKMEGSDDLEGGIVTQMKKFHQDLYENPLRVAVLCAQSTAQLWRRNGFSLVNQIHNYYSPLCRTEMFDKDVLMMQVGAAVQSPESFLVHVVHRYGLVSWADLQFEAAAANKEANATIKLENTETPKVVISLAEDMLQLLITICGERHRPGVGKCTLLDYLRREITHILAMGPHHFSQIQRKMPSDPILDKLPLHEVINDVADFKKPASTAAGQFHLKESLLEEYSPFFMHFSKSDVSQAELIQQKVRSKMSRKLQACAPPIPIEFEPFFKPIRLLLKSPTMVRLTRLVLERLSMRNRFSSDRLLHRTLYLIGMALHEQTADKSFDYTAVAEAGKILPLMEGLVNSSNQTSSHANLLWWTIQKYKEVERLAKFGTEKEKDKEVASYEKNADETKAKKAAMAATMRARAMQKMLQMQNTFLKKVDTPPVATDGAAPGEGTVVGENTNADKMAEVSQRKPVERPDDDEEFATMSPDAGFPVCLGANKTTVESVLPRRVTCIMCQEEDSLIPQSDAFVCAAFVQNSSLFAQRGAGDSSHYGHSKGFLYVPASLLKGADASTCSHTMHYQCYMDLASNALNRERQRTRQQMAYNQKMVDPEVGEYQCPLCKRLSNCAIPLLPALQLMEMQGMSSVNVGGSEDWEEWIWRVKEALESPPAAPTAHQKSFKGHSRKRSHSERSLLDLAKQGDELSSMPLDSGLSTSVPGASTVSLSTEGADQSAAFQDVLNLFASEQRNPGMPPSETAVSSDDVTKHQNRRATSVETTSGKNLAMLVNYFRDNVHKFLATKSISPSYDGFVDPIKAFIKFLSKRRRDGVLGEEKTKFAEGLRGYQYAMTCFHTTANVVRSIAAVLHNENKPLFGALNTRQRDCLMSMARLCVVCSYTMQHIPEHTQFALRILLTPPPSLTTPIPTLPPPSTPKSPDPHGHGLTPQLASSPPDWFATSPSSMDGFGTAAGGVGGTTASTPKLSPLQQLFYALANKSPSPTTDVNLLQVDMLSLAISLCMSIGWSMDKGKISFARSARSVRELIPDGSVAEHHVVRLCLTALYFQVLATFADAEMSENEQVEDAVAAVLRELWAVARPNDERLVDVDRLKKTLEEATLSFLRPVALFYFSISLVTPPEALKDPSLSEFEPLCRYVGMPTQLSELLSGNSVSRLFHMWSSALPADPSMALTMVRQPVRPRLLVDLPSAYSDLVHLAADYRCPTVPFEETSLSVPTMCLVCGQILCSQSYCCQRPYGKNTIGACRYHMIQCSGAMGIFMRIRECSVVLMTTRQRGCFRPAPYVDEFGETDQGFRRGNPLHLNRELYQKLRQIWLNQGITEEVINQYEMDHRNMHFEWAHF